jgi:hypothetical protein
MAAPSLEKIMETTAYVQGMGESIVYLIYSLHTFPAGG